MIKIMIISDEGLNIIASHDSDSYRIVFVEDSEKVWSNNGP